MADDITTGTSASSINRRSATDPAHTVEGRGSQDKDAGPRVRFSEDLIRATVSSTTGPRPGTPSLSINTTAAHDRQTSGESGRTPQSPLSPSSPTTPRTRDRGYSLRRSLFNRTIHTQSEISPIELAEAGPSREHDNSARTSEEVKGKQSHTAVTISPLPENISLFPEHAASFAPLPPRKSIDKKKILGSRILPNYSVFANERLQNHKHAVKIQEFTSRVFGEKKLPPSKDGRRIPLDSSRKEPLIDERTGNEYIGNTIRSSRYTIWNFFPRQLVFQFSKLANFYFLLISVLQMIPGLSTTGNYTTIAPLLVFVAISMAKEGYDDVRRYKLDQAENNRITLVLHAYQATQEDVEQVEKSTILKGRRRVLLPGKTLKASPTIQNESENNDGQEVAVRIQGPNHWASIKWRDVKVGDIIMLKRDDPAPADVVLLHADGPNRIAYIETMALDGETNLKSKQALPPLARLCDTVDEVAKCRANVVVEDPNLDLYNFDGRVTIHGETLPLTTNEVIFRGSTLRNTPSAIGMVLNTGEECKIRMNANKNPRIKAPAMQAISNKIVIMLVCFVIILSLFCTIAYQIWSSNVETKLWYLDKAHVPFHQIIIGFIILYNTLIPLSLYVSLEIIKVGQLILMADVEMYDPITDTPMTCNTTTILENLGQVDYIFSDKTGTLTDNIMKFRKLSIAGYAWLHDFDLQKEAEQLQQSREAETGQKKKGKAIAGKIARARPSLGYRNQSEMSEDTVRPSGSIRRSSSVWKSTARPKKMQPEGRTEEMLKFMQHKPHSVFTKKAKFFLLSLALCHTCLPEAQENGDIDFQAASPDELALVRAAQELGYLVIDRVAQSITLRHPDVAGQDSSEYASETYDVLDVIEFSSKRKRMSIIVRFPNGKICIFCKGADSAIMPRLKLAPLAMQKQSEVVRRASLRKSMEAEQALRRMSEHSPRTSFSRPSGSFSRSGNGRKSFTQSRPSMASARLQPIRDELDSWLRQRESDVEVAPDHISAYQSPRTSIAVGRFSSASEERRGSTQDEEYYEDMVEEAVVLDEALVFERCFQHIDDFASEGLRTLLFGYRYLDEEEYNGWKKVYVDATTSLVDRQKLIEIAGEMIEQNFDLAGATAIEDKLQKGVPETIDKLRRANIKIWMLTGDKRETAINIAHSARIAKDYSEVVLLDHTTGEVEQRMATTLLEISKGTIAHSVIVVDGQTLAEIDANETLALLFFDLAVVADSVICCRASPSQKASLVKTIRTKVKKSITLAIGDGANDINMIQEAHVGIGISGKEGLQAARISDYSIAQFRFLQRLLLVHGRWNYVRTAMYQKWNGYTGTSLFESTSLTVFNTLFTSLPVIFLGIFEQDLSASTLLAVPELYTHGQKNGAFNIKKYVAWMFMAVSESVIIYFTMYSLFGRIFVTTGNDLLALGTLCFSASVIFINTKMLVLEMHNKTAVSAFGWFLSVGGWWLWSVFLSLIYKPSKTFPLYPIYQDFTSIFGRNLLWWLVLLVTLAAVILLELAVSSVRKSFWPTDTDMFQELQKDSIIRQRFEETIRREENGESVDVGIEMGREVKSSVDMKREREIQALLDRPRIMRLVSDGEVVRSPIEMERDARRSLSGGGLTRTKVSVDVEEIPLEGRAREKFGRGSESNARRSVDIAEVLRGSGV